MIAILNASNALLFLSSNCAVYHNVTFADAHVVLLKLIFIINYRNNYVCSFPRSIFFLMWIYQKIVLQITHLWNNQYNKLNIYNKQIFLYKNIKNVELCIPSRKKFIFNKNCAWYIYQHTYVVVVNNFYVIFEGPLILVNF